METVEKLQQDAMDLKKKVLEGREKTFACIDDADFDSPDCNGHRQLQNAAGNAFGSASKIFQIKMMQQRKILKVIMAKYTDALGRRLPATCQRISRREADHLGRFNDEQDVCSTIAIFNG